MLVALTASAGAGAACDEAGSTMAVGTDIGVVLVFDKCRLMREPEVVRPFDAVARVHVAAGDVSGDGVADLVVGPSAGGGPNVRVFSGMDGSWSQVAPYGGFSGGVRVAVGDVNNDGRLDVVTAPGTSGAAEIRAYDGLTLELIAQIPLDRSIFAGGVYVAVGDVDNDAAGEVIVGAGAGSPPWVSVFAADGTGLSSFLAYDPQFLGGVRVAAGDLNGDGMADIVTGAGAGGGPHVKVFSGSSFDPIASFEAFDPQFQGGVFVAAAANDGTVSVTAGAPTGAVATIRIFGADGMVQWLKPLDGEKGGLTVAVSPGPMGRTPNRLRLPEGTKVGETW
jgi:hypothetical protein